VSSLLCPINWQGEAHEEHSTWFYQNIECATLGTLLDVMLIQCAPWHVTITPFSYKIVRKCTKVLGQSPKCTPKQVWLQLFSCRPAQFTALFHILYCQSSHLSHLPSLAAHLYTFFLDLGLDVARARSLLAACCSLAKHSTNLYHCVVIWPTQWLFCIWKLAFCMDPAEWFTFQCQYTLAWELQHSATFAGSCTPGPIHHVHKLYSLPQLMSTT